MWEETTYYIRDAQGNVMAVYKHTQPGGAPELRLEEMHIHGASRLGMTSIRNNEMITSANPTDDGVFTRTIGETRYELSNHLGNVLSVITDIKIAQDNMGSLDHYTAQVIMYSDYYPYGAPMDNPTNTLTDRNCGWGYRYGYNSTEICTSDLGYHSNITEFRLFDGRLARWNSTDPKWLEFPWQSTYIVMDANPIIIIDPTGASGEESTSQAGPTPIEAAMMAKHVYGGMNDDELVGGWRPVNLGVNITLEDSESGFKSQIYSRTLQDGTTEYAYVFAGTEDMSKDGVEDLLQAFGTSKQYDLAINNATELAKTVGTTNLTFVGHSLGGGLAQAAAMKTDGRAVTFNPAWVSVATRTFHSLWWNDADITNYIVFGEVLDNVQTAIGWRSGLLSSGENKYLNNWECWFKPFGTVTNHMIDNVIEELSDVEEYNKTKK